jgi:SAM-dependent methyltransferase
LTNVILRYVRNQQFNPGLLGAFVNPFFLARRGLWREIALASKDLDGPLLDIGCGTKPYRSLFSTERYVGLDIDSDATRRLAIADHFYDGHSFPFEDAQFQSILCNQVLEHVFNPSEFLTEVRRVLQPGGRILLTVPFVWDEHEQPYDYARYSSFGLKSLLQQHRFRIVRHTKLLTDVSIFSQLTIAYLYKVTLSRNKYANALMTAAVFGPISLFGVLLGKCLPKNEDFFLDQLVVAEAEA